MAKVRKDLTGQVFTRWEVLNQVKDYIEPNGIHRDKWLCICDCGVKREVRGKDLRSGKTKSCGCWNIDNLTKHGYAHHPLYKIWVGVKQRCYNSKSTGYKNYGDRGIIVCQEWINNPKAFIEWSLINGWDKSLDIDRIDNNGNYSPSNCRFVTRSVNCVNQRIRTDNKSEYSGIYWRKKAKKWEATLTNKRKQSYLGLFTIKKEALEMRNKYITDNKLPHKIQEWRS